MDRSYSLMEGARFLLKSSADGIHEGSCKANASFGRTRVGDERDAFLGRGYDSGHPGKRVGLIPGSFLHFNAFGANRRGGQACRGWDYGSRWAGPFLREKSRGPGSGPEVGTGRTGLHPSAGSHYALYRKKGSPVAQRLVRGLHGGRSRRNGGPP